MKEDLTLLILAAGLGSRFGGLKQLTPVGPGGEFIIDYSLYDARRAGFNKVVFVIKEENYDLFKETVGSRVEGKFDSVGYAFQKGDDLPGEFEWPKGRSKPWGTGHAILAARNLVKGKFGVIGADDFYGYDAFNKLAESLRNMNGDEHDYSLIGYLIKNTISQNGTVKRGTCEAENGCITKIVEAVVENQDGCLTAKPLDGRPEFKMSEDHLVSMVMFGYNDTVFNILGDMFTDFLNKNKESLENAEFIFTDSMGEYIGKGNIQMKLYRTDAVWQGITYIEDLEGVKKSIRRLIDVNEYPKYLWK